MDQSAFRSLLASSSSGARPARDPASSVLGAGSRKRGRDVPEASTSFGYGASPTDQLKPRAATKKDSSKAKGGGARSESAEAADAEAKEPSYRRYGYTDRASMRRAGLEDDEEREREEQQARRPRGLDLSLLDSAKRALLTGKSEDEPPPADKDTPKKTEEEIERELEEAGKALIEDGSESKGVPQPAAAAPPPPKKQKRSRAEMLRDLQAKIAAAASGAAGAKEDTANSSNGSEREQTGKASSMKAEVTTPAEAQPATMKGFKVISRDEPKKKKKKKRVEDAEAGALDGLKTDAHQKITGVVGSGLDSNTAADATSVSYDSSKAGIALAPDADTGDAFDDFFGEVGEYDDGLSADEEENEATAEASAIIQNDGDSSKDRTGNRYFEEDAEPVIPRFEAYRSPTPPPRERRTSRDRSPSPSAAQTDDPETAAKRKPARLQGFADSSYTAKDLLAFDDYQAKEEARKLKKLKGKEKREAMEAQKEREGGTKDEKDKLNKELMQYESYERRKKGKEAGNVTPAK